MDKKGQEIRVVRRSALQNEVNQTFCGLYLVILK